MDLTICKKPMPTLLKEMEMVRSVMSLSKGSGSFSLEKTAHHHP